MPVRCQKGQLWVQKQAKEERTWVTERVHSLMEKGSLGCVQREHSSSCTWVPLCWVTDQDPRMSLAEGPYLVAFENRFYGVLCIGKSCHL